MIYYFKGNRLRGLDLTMELEEIAIKRHHRWAERKIGIPKGAYHNYKDVCTRMKIENEYPCNVNPSAIEGERVNKLYYLTGRTLKRCKLKSFKSFLIQLFGKNIENDNKRTQKVH